jgi:hypothetical protein
MISIYEQRLVTIQIDQNHFAVCNRIHRIIDRWGRGNFELIFPGQWDNETVLFKFWVRLHPVDASKAIDEIWQAAQGTLDINRLDPIHLI